jgi:hypothetical protein
VLKITRDGKTLIEQRKMIPFGRNQQPRLNPFVKGQSAGLLIFLCSQVSMSLAMAQSRSGAAIATCKDAA